MSHTSFEAPEPTQTNVNKWIWPGLLIALPASVIVASAITAVFMVGRPDGLVASDYYKQGKAINAQLAKFARAQSLGFDAMFFETQGDGVSIRFPNAMSAASPVEFVFAHPIDESKDVRLVIAPDVQGLYVFVPPTRFQERRRVIASDFPNKSWRSEALFEPRRTSQPRTNAP
jgi:uncharacterized protein